MTVDMASMERKVEPGQHHDDELLRIFFFFLFFCLSCYQFSPWSGLAHIALSSGWLFISTSSAWHQHLTFSGLPPFLLPV